MYLVLEHEVLKIYIKSSVLRILIDIEHARTALGPNCCSCVSLTYGPDGAHNCIVTCTWGKPLLDSKKKTKTKQKTKKHKITTLTKAVTLNSGVYFSLINSESRVIFVTLGFFFFFFFFYRSIYLFSRLGSSLTRDRCCRRISCLLEQLINVATFTLLTYLTIVTKLSYFVATALLHTRER